MYFNKKMIVSAAVAANILGCIILLKVSELYYCKIQFSKMLPQIQSILCCLQANESVTFIAAWL